MFIPLRTNRPPKRRPIVTELLIAVNMLVFLFGLIAEFTGFFDRATMIEFGSLSRQNFHVPQLLSYQFLHDPSSIWHLAFNMLFLWVFGCAVEDRIGRSSFLAFYLIGGAVAGIAHMMRTPAPVIGASGSVAAITGAFLALFPRSKIQVLIIFFFYVGVWAVPALWFIGFFFLIDMGRSVLSVLGGRGDNVAYMAHIAGYLYGFALAFTLLATGIVKREEFDVFYLFKQSRRRAAFTAAARGKAAGPWESAPTDTGSRLARQAKRVRPITDEDRTRSAARSEITRLVVEHDLPAAAARYRRLLESEPDTTFAEQVQLDLANQFQAEEDHARAAQSYELLLKHNPSAASAAEVRLILGLIYARHLDRPDRARELITAARTRLQNDDQKSLADQLLADLAS